MGRKIPGKKHRGVKDPLKQQARRRAELENVINAPPKDIDQQAVPKSLQRVVKLKEAVKSGKITKLKNKKKKKKLISVGTQNYKALHPKAKPDKVVPVFEQKPGESEERFMHRVSRDAHAFISETAFERKYGVDVQRNPETGKIEGLSKWEKSEFYEIEKLRAKHRNVKKKKKKKNLDEPKMTKSQKRKEKIRLKKEHKEQEQMDEFKSLQDQVEFGEVVHEPPQLTVRPKKAEAVDSSKPGKKELLLHSLLKKNGTSKKSTKKATVIDRSGKRKNLPVGERRQLEKQQSEIIAAYKSLKAQRSAGTSE